MKQNEKSTFTFKWKLFYQKCHSFTNSRELVQCEEILGGK